MRAPDASLRADERPNPAENRYATQGLAPPLDSPSSLYREPIADGDEVVGVIPQAARLGE
jgi:hypothetical protein